MVNWRRIWKCLDSEELPDRSIPFMEVCLRKFSFRSIEVFGYSFDRVTNVAYEVIAKKPPNP